MPQLTSTQSGLIRSVAKGNSLVVRNKSGVETVTGSSVAREDATAILGAGAYVYGPQTADSTLTISTTGVLDYDIVAGDPTPAGGAALVTRNASTGSPSGLIDPATGQPLGGGGGAGLVLSPDAFIPNDTGAYARAQNAALLADAFARNGLVWLPALDICHDPIVITGRPTIRGQGAGDPYGPEDIGASTIDLGVFGAAGQTILRTIHDSGAALTVQTPGVSFEALKIVNLATHAASNDQILIHAGPDATRAKRADGFKVRGVNFVGGYVQLKAGSALGWSSIDCGYLDPDAGYSIWVENYMNGDEGDPAVIGNTFNAYSKPAEAALYFRAGGGLKFIGNKINRQPGNNGSMDTRWYRRGVYIKPIAGTSVFPCTGNSIENCRYAGIEVDCSTTGNYANGVVTGNEIFNCGMNGEPSVKIVGRAATLVQNWNISENTLHASGGIYVENVDNMRVGKNMHLGARGDLFTAAGKTPNCSFEAQRGGTFSGDRTLHKHTGLNDTDTQTSRQSEVLQYSRSLKGINKTAKNLFYVGLDGYTAAKIDIDIAASASGVGITALRMSRTLIRDGSNDVLIIGSDTGVSKISGTNTAVSPTSTALSAAVQDIQVALVYATIDGFAGHYIAVSIPAGSASSTISNGDITLTVSGAPASVRWIV